MTSKCFFQKFLTGRVFGIFLKKPDTPNIESKNLEDSLQDSYIGFGPKGIVFTNTFPGNWLEVKIFHSKMLEFNPTFQLIFY